MSEILVGTCSWKFPSWRGLIYPETGGENYLEEYSRHFKTVEIDQWFWSLFEEDKVKLPDPGTVIEYNESVPDDFEFSIKVPNSITLTHHYSKDRSLPLKENPHFLSNEIFEAFLRKIAPFGKKTGPLIFQFEYLNKKKMGSQAEFQEKFSEFIKNCPENYKYSAEIRNPNYLNEDYFEFLSRNRLHHVFMHGYYMPSIFKVYREFFQQIEGYTVIRLMGSDRQRMERRTRNRWDRIVMNRNEELDQLKIMIEEMNNNGIKIYLNINNHYEGSAPLTIRKIQERLNI